MRQATRTHSTTGKKNSRNNSQALQTRTKAKSRGTIQGKSVGVFRPDLLEYNPTEKSGYMFFEVQGAYSKKDIARYWLNCLKKHENYKSVLIPSNADLPTIFQVLHHETDRLLKGYNWILSLENEDNEPTLYYYKSLGDIGMRGIPLDWFDNSTDFAFRNCGLFLMKCLAEAFGIKMITNDLFEIGFENLTYDPNELMHQLKERFDSGEKRDWLEIHKAAADVLEYRYGRVPELNEYLKTISYSKKEIFDNNLLESAGHDSKLWEWFMEGYEILQGETVDIDCFNFFPDSLHHDDEKPVSLEYSLFFPYSFNGFMFEYYEEWLNDQANHFGTNDIYKYGVLTDKIHVKPTNEEPLLKLIKFLDKGRDIYFKQNNFKRYGY